MVVFGDQVTKILHNSLFTFFTEQGKTGKTGTHWNEHLATYFWYFGSFDEKRTYEKYVMSRVFATPLKSTKIFHEKNCTYLHSRLAKTCDDNVT